MRERSRSRRTADHESTVADRLTEIFNNHRPLQDLDGTHRSTIRFLRGEAMRANKHESRERHRLHRARDRANVAGMSWFYEDDANVVEHELGLASKG